MWATDSAFWDYNCQTKEIKYSEKKAQLLGYTSEELGNDPLKIAKLIHPDDYEKAMTAMGNLLGGVTETYEVDYRIITKDGSWK